MHSYKKKLEVALAYKDLLAKSITISERSLAKAARVGKTFARNIINEIEFCYIVMPSKKRATNGVGSLSCDGDMEFVLLVSNCPFAIYRDYLGLTMDRTLSWTVFLGQKKMSVFHRLLVGVLVK